MKKLYRSITDRRVAGVCGGLGEYFGIDPVIFRILFGVALVVYGTGVLLYIVMALIIPSKSYRQDEDSRYYSNYYRSFESNGRRRKDVTPEDE